MAAKNATTNAKTAVNGGAASVLTLAELLPAPELTPIEIPQLSKDGKPGIVYRRPLTAGVVIDMVVDTNSRPTGAALRTLISESICDENGNLLFAGSNIDRIDDLRLDIFTVLSAEVMKGMAPPADEAQAEGKAESSDDASSTGSPSN